MFRPFLAGVLALATMECFATEWYVEARYDDPAALRRVGGLFTHVTVDEKARVLRVDTDDDGIRLLEQAGMHVSVDMVRTAELRALAAPPGDLRSIPQFACYRTVEETRTDAEALVAAYPELASIESLGPTWERDNGPGAGYDMYALRITRHDTLADNPERPRMVVLASIHAREYAPAELVTRFAEGLLDGYGRDPQATWLVDHVDFRLVLHANPDGRKKAEAGVLWRKNTNTTNGTSCGTPSSNNHAGIDLNRNWPFHWNTAPGGSSGAACNAVYRGPTPASEPETQNLIRYVAGTPGPDGAFVGGALPDRKDDAVTVAAPDDYKGLFFDIHSYAGLVLWPWGDTLTVSPNGEALQTLGRRIAWFNGYTPQRASQLYATDGGTIDLVYGQLGAPAYVMEIGTEFFQPCSSFENTILPVNLQALRFAARTAEAPYRLGKGPDVHSLAVEYAVEPGEDAVIRATIDDTRFRQTSAAQPTFAITSAHAYVGRLPWQTDGGVTAFEPVDGAYNSTQERVMARVPMNGLAPGRHLVYVQGVNASGGGTAGAPDAVYVQVLESGDRIFRDGLEIAPD
ncbi:M14 family zinc carboxypeptidase [Dokdonella sp. MW10]|uniref:M14 family zinc carboxypeptidase n=1 Tax=Dokdonella sp. MW10 TaxID=2992926 RepID=UPI003F81C7FE